MGNKKKKALVFGILGQDGSYLAELLHNKGYEIYGVIRENQQDGAGSRIQWIRDIVPNVNLFMANVTDKKIIMQVIKSVEPHEIYNFIADSNVFSAWSNLDYTMQLNALLPQYILEGILATSMNIKYFQASSCLIFGRDKNGMQNEKTPANPIHPYGISKLYADNMVKEFRSVFGLFACSGIFFNHESERRGEQFFTKKITSAVARIKNGSNEKIKVGNLNVCRDYGYAPDYMEAVYLMMQSDKPVDYVIGTGELMMLDEFVVRSFDHVGLHPKEHIQYDETLNRKNDTPVLCADTRKIEQELGWKPKTDVCDMIRKMVDFEMKKTDWQYGVNFVHEGH